jgi:class 3 adenylate cyclase/PAS domain-containing protein
MGASCSSKSATVVAPVRSFGAFSGAPPVCSPTALSIAQIEKMITPSLDEKSKQSDKMDIPDLFSSRPKSIKKGSQTNIGSFQSSQHRKTKHKTVPSISIRSHDNDGPRLISTDTVCGARKKKHMRNKSETISASVNSRLIRKLTQSQIDLIDGYDTILGTFPDGIAIITNTNVISYVNDVMQAMFPDMKGTLTGRNIHSLFPDFPFNFVEVTATTGHWDEYMFRKPKSSELFIDPRGMLIEELKSESPPITPIPLTSVPITPFPTLCSQPGGVMAEISKTVIITPRTHVSSPPTTPPTGSSTTWPVNSPPTPPTGSSTTWPINSPPTTPLAGSPPTTPPVGSSIAWTKNPLGLHSSMGSSSTPPMIPLVDALSSSSFVKYISEPVHEGKSALRVCVDAPPYILGSVPRTLTPDSKYWVGNTYLEISYGKLKQGEFLVHFKDITDRILLEKELYQASMRKEQLIEALLPKNKELVTRFKNGEKNIFSFHSDVTIGFCDVVHFTKLTNDNPHKITLILNKLFDKLDSLVSSLGISKIETVGDCYMVASGLFDSDESNPSKVIEFMLQAVAFVKYEMGIQLRCGVHRGPVYSGILGTILPHFSLFGMSVIVAARLETTSSASKIHASDYVVDALNKDDYTIIDAGKPDLKGLGASINTFFIERA